MKKSIIEQLNGMTVAQLEDLIARCQQLIQMKMLLSSLVEEEN
jgi:hypothetical protein